MYPEDEIARLFPTIAAAPEMPNVDDYNPRRDDDDGYLPQRRHDDDVQVRGLRGGHQGRGDRKKIERLPAKRAAQ